MKTKLGSYKLIFNVFQLSDKLFVSVDLADIDFTGFNVKSIKTIYENIINPLSETYQNDVFSMNNDLKTVFKMMEINLGRTKKFINFASTYMFNEKIVLPKLSAVESQKSLNLELTKLYPDYENKFVYDSIAVKVDQTNVFRTSLISKRYYYDISNLFKDLKTTFESINVSSNSLRRSLLKANVFNKKKKILFIDIFSEASICVSHNGDIDNGAITCNCGYMSFVRNIAKYLNQKEEDVLHELCSQHNYRNEIPPKAYEEIVSESYKDLLINVMRMIGYFYVENLYDGIYCHVENKTGDFAISDLEELLKVEFSNIKRNVKNVHYLHLLSSGALIKPTPIDYKLPLKVKKYEESLQEK